MQRLVEKLFSQAEMGSGKSWRRCTPPPETQIGPSCLPLALSTAMTMKKNIDAGKTEAPTARLSQHSLYRLLGECGSTRLQASIAAGIWGLQYSDKKKAGFEEVSIMKGSFQQEMDRAPVPHHVRDPPPVDYDPCNPLIYLEDFHVATSKKEMSAYIYSGPGVTSLYINRKLKRLFMKKGGYPHPKASDIYNGTPPKPSSVRQDNPDKTVLHAFVVVAYCPEGKYYILQNSYSDEWGIGGFFKVHEDLIKYILFPTKLGKSPSSKLHRWMTKYEDDLEEQLTNSKELYQEQKKQAGSEDMKKKSEDEFERVFRHLTGWKLWVMDRLREMEGKDPSEFKELCQKWGCSPDDAPNVWMDS